MSSSDKKPGGIRRGPDGRRKTARDMAKTYISSRGWKVVPISRSKKGPKIRGWPDLDIKAGEVDEYFQLDDNIGILLGEPSGGLTDIDLDAPEAVGLASTWLPDTGLIHGRPSKPESHYWYQVKRCPDSKKYTDVDGTCLVEIRATGQTMAPESLHPDRERVAWNGPKVFARGSRDYGLAIDRHGLAKRLGTARGVSIVAVCTRNEPEAS